MQGMSSSPKKPSSTSSKKSSLPSHYLNKNRVNQQRDLSQSFFEQGKNLLQYSDFSGIQLFDLSEKLDPENPDLVYQMGIFLLEVTTSDLDKKKYLKFANRYFKKSSLLKNNSFLLWKMWGKTLQTLGESGNECHYFLDAKRKYQKALTFIKEESADSQAAIYWDYGKVWRAISNRSGEASDLQIAIDAFHKASKCLKNLPCQFWMDYGDCYFKLASYINDLSLYVKALHCYKNSISISISSFDAWYRLARTLKELYHYTDDEDHFIGANESFHTALQLGPSNLDLFCSWIDMLIISGGRLKDSKRTRSAIEKCQKVSQYHPKNTRVYLLWAHALAQLGSIKEQVHLIVEAKNKLSVILETLEEESIDLWLTHGNILLAFANYFNDLDYYYQAIEKFQAGLSIDRTNHVLWHKLATTYTIAARLECDSMIYERAEKFYARALHHCQNNEYHFDFAKHLFYHSELINNQKLLEQSIFHFEQALQQKNAIYRHPNWLFYYGRALDQMGDFLEEDSYYTKAIEIFIHVLMLDPQYPDIHYHLALVYTHVGELMSDITYMEKSIHHFRMAHARDEENSLIILDWGLTILSLSQHCSHAYEIEDLYKEAEMKFIISAKMGNSQAYYHLSCLYSTIGQLDYAIYFFEKAKLYESLPELDELLQDDWLYNLRETDFFKNFIAHLENH